jgi:hypothetical protein
MIKRAKAKGEREVVSDAFLRERKLKRKKKLTERC